MRLWHLLRSREHENSRFPSFCYGYPPETRGEKMRAGSDHEGDGGWPYREVEKEKEWIKKHRRVVSAEGQDVLAEVIAYKPEEPKATV